MTTLENALGTPGIGKRLTLTMFCARCTREHNFTAKDHAGALQQAMAAGWKMRGNAPICVACKKKGY